MPLTRFTGTYGPYGGKNIWRYWLLFFYYYVLEEGYTIHDALDAASQMVGFAGFWDTPPYKGWNETNPEYPGMGLPWYWCKLRVYGNGNIYLPYGWA
ncbi:MAG: hypothetical protein QW146_07575 [Candidatus Bathyarchaeia archaeon]